MSREPDDQQVRLEKIIAEYLKAVDAGQLPEPEIYLSQHPDLADELRAFFQAQAEIEDLAAEPAGSENSPDATEATFVTAGSPAVEPTLVPDTEPTTKSRPPRDRVGYFGDYELISEIARGGMGVVYNARQVNLDRVVALKMILSGQFASEEDVRRFYQEAEAAAKLDHPSIVPIFEVGQHEGHHFFSMGFVDGPSLAQLIASGPLPAKTSAEIVRYVAEAIRYAHGRGVIHRDLKPANVLMARFNEQTDQTKNHAVTVPPAIDGNEPVGCYHPKVTDFGLAKKAEGGSDLTGTGQILGTPSYMPPEQAAGHAQQIGPSADIYSLGAILYCLLTGQPPFQSANVMDTLMQVLEKEPVSPREINPQIPKDLETICLKCLQKDRRQRYGSAQTLVDELNRFLRGEPILARPVSRITRSWRWCRRNPVVASLIGLVFIVLVAGIVVSTRFAVESQEREVQVQTKADELQIANEELDQKLVELDTANQRLEKAVTRADREATLARKRLYTVHLSAALREWEVGDVELAWQNLNQCPEGFRGWEYDYVRAVLTERQQTAEANRLGGIKCGTYSPNGTMIAFGDYAQRVMLWDGIAQPQILHKTDELRLTSIAFSADANQLFSLGSKELNIFNVPEKKLVQTLVRPTIRFKLGFYTTKGPAWHLQYSDLSQDATRLVAKNGNNKLCIWAPATGEELCELEEAPRWPQCFAFSSDSHWLAAGNRDGELFLWNTKTGRSAGRIQAHQGKISAVAFSPDGKRVVTASWDNVAKIWDVENAKEIRTLEGHSRGLTCVAFSGDGQRVVTGSYDKLLKVWDAISGETLETLKGHKRGPTWVRWSPTENRILSGAKGLKIWNLEGDCVQHSFKLARNFSNEVAFSPSTKQLVYCKPNYEIEVVDWNSVTTRATFPAHSLVRFGRTLKAGTNALAFSQNGNLIASGSASMIRIDDIATGKTHHLIQNRRSGTQCLDFSHDGTILASASRSHPGSIDLWNVTTGAHLTTLKFGEERFTSVVFSPDQQFLAAKTFDNLVIWYLKTRSLHRRYHEQNLTGTIDFSPDGRRIVSGHKDSMVRVWNVNEDDSELQLKGHTRSVNTVKFSPNGKRILSGGDDHMVKVWDADTGELLLTLEGHTVAVVEVDFGRKGRSIVSTGSNGRIITWTVPNKPEEIVMLPDPQETK